MTASNSKATRYDVVIRDPLLNREIVIAKSITKTELKVYEKTLVVRYVVRTSS